MAPHDPAFGKLGREVEHFANHVQRLLRAAQKQRSGLGRAIKWVGRAAPLDARPDSPSVAMKAIDQYARIHDEDRLELIGAYFAHHHLRAQAELARALFKRTHRAPQEARAAACVAVHQRAERERRAWISALLDTCIQVACADLDPDSYAAFNVGSLNDHEDVDLAVVVRSIEAREDLDKAFAVVAKTFLRYASKLQIFLTEQLATPRIGGLIEEYEEHLDKDPGVVVVMQLLGAELLSGSRELAQAFRERVTERYYADASQAGEHESLLRAVMRELKHHQSLERVGEALAPKREVYIPAKLVITATRAVMGVRGRPIPSLDTLAEEHPDRAATYQRLRDAFAENEVLRWLLFLYVQKHEEVDLFEPSIRPAARRVAMLLGLPRRPKQDPAVALSNYYREVRARALGSVFELSFELNQQVHKLPGFQRLLSLAHEVSRGKKNAPQSLLAGIEALGGKVYWEEVVEILGNERPLVARLDSDFRRLEPAEQRALAHAYARVLVGNPASALELLEVLCSAGDSTPGRMADHLWDALLEILRSDRSRQESFVSKLEQAVDPEALHRIASAGSAEKLSALATLVAEQSGSTAGQRLVRAISAVLVLHDHHSNAMGRVIARVQGRTPEFMRRLADAERLRSLARDLWQEAQREQVPREQIELLGDSFDVDFLRLALSVILGGSPATRDAEYSASFDRYVRELYRASVKSGNPQAPIASPETGLAVFATGGVGRTEAFAADWDYFAVVSSEETSLVELHSRTIQRVEGALARRGIVSHNRLTEPFGAYAVSIEDLFRYLEARSPSTFIDEAEILEARFLFGDPEVQMAFARRLANYIASPSFGRFLGELLAELTALRQFHPIGLSLKHGPGGLREQQLLWLILKVLTGPFALPLAELLARAVAALPSVEDDLRSLHRARLELRRIRDLYRLMVGIEEPIDVPLLLQLTERLPALEQRGVPWAEDIERLMADSAHRIDRVAEALRRAIARGSPLSGD